jgi:hypothetical protein
MNATNTASLLARLLALAKQRGEDYSLVLNRFAMERLLCRLGQSDHAERFLLKGAMLFAIWYDEPHRPTRDVDLLGFGQDDAEHLVVLFSEVAAITMDDGLDFDVGAIRADAIREDNSYGGTRIHLPARLGSARCGVQVDVGFGDAVTPAAQTMVLPVLLPELGAPSLRVYPVYTVIAEKYHAMVILGLANSRMKDFFDLAVIAHRTVLDGAILGAAIHATFTRRATSVPEHPTLALTASFSEDPMKIRQWQAFLRKNAIPVTASLADTVALQAKVLLPATAVALGQISAQTWQPIPSQWE